MGRKQQTLDQLEKTKEKAVRFVRDVLDDDDRADEIEDESLEDYAARKRITILQNPRRQIMAKSPRKDELQDALDSVYDRLSDAYDPTLSREQVMSKIGDILNDIEPDDDDEDDLDDEDEDDEE